MNRPDLIDRLLVFWVDKIGDPLTSEQLYGPLEAHRTELWAEVIANLQCLVWLFERDEERKEFQAGLTPELARGLEPLPLPFRIADWAEVGRRMCGAASLWGFRWALEAQGTVKQEMTLDEDEVFQIIYYIAYRMAEKDSSWRLKDLRGSELFGRMCGAAELVGLAEFGSKRSKFPSMQSVIQHLPHILEEMEKHLYVNTYRRGSDDKVYTFLRLDDEEVRVPKQHAELLDLDPDDIYDPGGGRTYPEPIARSRCHEGAADRYVGCATGPAAKEEG